jgi:agmatine/peptidylarginine deiminase
MSSPTHFPPEWAEQSAVLVAWPYASGDFSPWLGAVEDSYCRIAAAIAARQRLLIVCRDRDHRRHIETRLFGRRVDLRRVTLLELPYDDVWVRDTAPLTVEAAGVAQMLDFRFNGWGGKYPHDRDAKLAARLHATGVFPRTPLQAVGMVLEGGSVETDGRGTLLTTARCLLNPNRNPALDRAAIESQLRDCFGVQRILWLHHGHAEGDDTDAHVDTLARFCDTGTIAYTACGDPADPLYGDLRSMEQELNGFTTPDGAPYRLVPLPIPRPILDEDGRRLPATYANFLIINGAVLLPVYDDPCDQIALERLAGCFPDRDIVAIPATPLIRQYGSIHCMTMQFPSSVPLGSNHD